jgi:cephalosporin hydroxylase
MTNEPLDSRDPRDPRDPRDATRTLNAKAFEYRSYLNFRRLGRPIVQNEKAISEHAMSEPIRVIKGSSTDPTDPQVAKSHERVMGVLDSHHSHDHVKAELTAFRTPDPQRGPGRIFARGLQ